LTVRTIDKTRQTRQTALDGASQFRLEKPTMVVDIDIREQLSYFCMVNKLTQEKAANVALREMLERVDQDPELKARMNRAKELHEAMKNL
jgi:hypothetical protein